MEYDFNKICRICLSEGVMMSIFKVHINKKIMACSSIQVWQNDGLPGQICNKCVAKLHISFQFKKQCEKSDAKLRQYLSQNTQQNTQEEQEQNQQHPNIPEPPPPQPQNNCVYVECTPTVDIVSTQDITSHEEQDQCHYDNGIPVTSTGSVLSQITYNPQSMDLLQQQNHISIPSYNIPTMGQFPPMYNVQPLNVGQVSLPVSSSNNILTLGVNQVQQTQMPLAPQQIQIQSVQQPTHQQPPPHNQIDDHIKEEKDLNKRVGKLKKEQNQLDTDQKPCQTCGKIFANSAKLNRHMKIHSSDMPYKCNVCQKAFAHSGNYKIHMRMHTDERPYRCSVCDKGCRQAQDLEKHMRTHTGERPHRCTLCPRAFSTSSNLIAHVRTHTGERPYVCSVCQKAFCQSNELTKHMRTHTGEKSHICSVCQRGFNGSSTLIVHMRSHTGERPYICSKCNKGFAQSSCLAIHMKRHNGEKNYRCTECDRAFVVSTDLKEHMLTHAVEKPYGCNMCDKRFLRANDLNRHTKTHSM